MNQFREFKGNLIPPDYSVQILPGEPRGLIDPGAAGGGVTGSSGAANGATEPAVKPEDLPEDSPAVEGEFSILPYPEPETQPFPKEDVVEDFAFTDDTDWARYEEMMNRLAEVRTQG